MARDAQGHIIADATAETAALIDTATRAFTMGYGDPIAALDAARAQSPACALAHIAKAWILVLSNDPLLANAARPLMETARGLALDDRSRSHMAALAHAVEGHRGPAVGVLERHLMAYPHDLLAHFAAMLLDAFNGRFANAAQRAARALPLWSKTQESYGILLSFYGFGLEEAADYGRAEDVSRAAAEMEPYSYWPHHAVSHVLEMTARPKEGLAWMDQREPLWSKNEHSGQAHIWWHKALFHVELGDYEEAMRLYDGPIISTQKPAGIGLTHTPALLWRLEILGCEGGERWQALADLWRGHADGRYCVFADIHAAMAELKAGRDTAVENRLAAMRRTAADTSESAPAYRDVGLPVVQGLAAYQRGDHARAVDHLLAVRPELFRMGGSKAQRDVIEWTLNDAAARAGLRDVAIALANERLAARPLSAPNRQFIANAEAIAAP
ncbi:MAG: tetratricopeptide repeat protein [Hyphomicrobiaceae bacterium]